MLLPLPDVVMEPGRVVDTPDEVHALSFGAGVEEKTMNEPGANEMNEALLKSKLQTID